jgi:hypothetical protein
MFDRQRYERALEQIDEAPMLEDYYAGLCALAEAQGRVPDPRFVAHALGLSPPDTAALEQFNGRVTAGQLAGATVAQVHDELWYRRPMVAAQRSTEGSSAARTRSANGSATTPPVVERPAPSSALGERQAVRQWSDFTITVGPTVLSRIEREIHEAVQAFHTNVETGGWLYAHYTPDAQGVPIIQATGPGQSAKHSASRLTLSHPRELEDELASSAVLVGDWHTHPGAWTGDPTDQASDADEEAWKGRLEKLASGSRWVGLIFTPGVMGWTSPLYFGFLTHENEHGVVCEQATVIEGQISSGWVA